MVNEAVNFDKQCIFVAVPKTGSTAVRSQLRQSGIPLIENPHLNIIQIRDALYVYFLKEALGKNTSFPTSHVATDAEIRSKARETFDVFFKFSAVRNPWARAVSLYFRREGVKIQERISFEEFCKHHWFSSDTCRHPTLHQNQFDWLSDENGKIIMDYVYKLEDFDKAVKEIAEQTKNRIRLDLKYSNKNPQSRSDCYKNMYTEETRKLIAKRFEKDIDEFKFIF